MRRATGTFTLSTPAQRAGAVRPPRRRRSGTRARPPPAAHGGSEHVDGRAGRRCRRAWARARLHAPPVVVAPGCGLRGHAVGDSAAPRRDGRGRVSTRRAHRDGLPARASRGATRLEATFPCGSDENVEGGAVRSWSCRICRPVHCRVISGRTPGRLRASGLQTGARAGASALTGSSRAQTGGVSVAVHAGVTPGDGRDHRRPSRCRTRAHEAKSMARLRTKDPLGFRRPPREPSASCLTTARHDRRAATHRRSRRGYGLLHRAVPADPLTRHRNRRGRGIWVALRVAGLPELGGGSSAPLTRPISASHVSGARSQGGGPWPPAVFRARDSSVSRGAPRQGILTGRRRRGSAMVVREGPAAPSAWSREGRI